MTSETRFSAGYTSMWREVIPLSDGYWSMENMLTRRVAEPVLNRAPKEMRGLVNELAFIGFAELAESTYSVSLQQILRTLTSNIEVAVKYINRVSTAEDIRLTAIDEACLSESAEICQRLLTFFPKGVERHIRPKFKGCGFINACEGDVLVGQSLFEVKAGDRGFRVSDMRQLLTYAALAYASDNLNFSRVGLFNPRTGMAWAKSLDEICIAVSGLKANDVLPKLIEQMQPNSVSR